MLQATKTVTSPVLVAWLTPCPKNTPCFEEALHMPASTTLVWQHEANQLNWSPNVCKARDAKQSKETKEDVAGGGEEEGESVQARNQSGGFW